MAFIPTGKSGQFGAVGQAPGVNSASFGLIGDALAGLGKNVTDIGVDLLERQTRSTENDFLLEKSTDDMLAMQKFTTQKTAAMASAKDAIQYPIDADKFIKDRLEQNEKEAPTERARQEYKNSSVQFFTREYLNVQLASQKQQGLFKEQNIIDKADTLASSQVSFPDFNKAVESIGILKKNIDENDGTLFDPAHGNKIREKAFNSVALGAFEGFLQNDNIQSGQYAANLKNGLAELSKEGEGSMSYYLDPKQKASLVGKYNNALKQEAQKDVSSIGREVNDIQASVRNLVVPPQAAYSNLLQRLEVANSSGAIDPDSYKRTKSTVQVLSQAGALLSSIKNKPISEWGDPNTLVSGGTFNFADKDQARDVVASAMRAEQEKRYDDFPKYAAEASQKIQNLQKQAMGGDPQAISAYIAEVNAYADFLQIPMDKRRTLSKDFSLFIGTQLSALKGAEQKAQLLETYKNSFGPNWNAALIDMARDKQIPVDYLSISHMPDTKTKAKLIANSDNAAAISDNFKKSMPGVSDNVLLSELLSIDSELNTHLVGSGGDPMNMAFASSIMSQVALEAKKSIANGANRGAALQTAYDEVIGNNFDKVAGGSSAILVPKGNDKDKISKFLSLTSTKKGVSGLDISLSANGRSKDNNDEYLSQNAYWDVTPERNGIAMYVTGASGIPEKILRKDGGHYIVPFDKIDSELQKLTEQGIDHRTELGLQTIKEQNTNRANMIKKWFGN